MGVTLRHLRADGSMAVARTTELQLDVERRLVHAANLEGGVLDGGPSVRARALAGDLARATFELQRDVDVSLPQAEVRLWADTLRYQRDGTLAAAGVVKAHARRGSIEVTLEADLLRHDPATQQTHAWPARAAITDREGTWSADGNEAVSDGRHLRIHGAARLRHRGVVERCQDIEFEGLPTSLVRCW